MNVEDVQVRRAARMHMYERIKKKVHEYVIGKGMT